jgi:hypothetical protein
VLNDTTTLHSETRAEVERRMTEALDDAERFVREMKARIWGGMPKTP